jgi:hypothetical protein
MMQFKGGGGMHVCCVSFPFVSPPASEEANLVSVTNCHFFQLDAPNSVECGGLGFIGSARLNRSHFKSRNLLNSFRAGAHCDLVTLDVSTLFSEGD